MSSSDTRKSRSRWKRRSRRDTDDSNNNNYVPPALDGAPEEVNGGTEEAGGDQFFVTSPPRQKQTLTGSISTLFRRAGSSREPPGHQNMMQASPDSGADTSATEDDAVERKGTAATPSNRAHHHKRIFYSSNDDDESEDSYESRVSRALSERSGRNDMMSSDDDDRSPASSKSLFSGEGKTILRYRGFSTSIKSLFLDESLVCASMGCFGLILSNRTEHLLELRNKRRGVNRHGRNKRPLPSRILAYALLGTMMLIASTFVIWGFGNGQVSYAHNYVDGYDILDDVYTDDAYDVANGDDGNYNDDGGNGDDGNNGDDAYNDDGQQAAGDDGGGDDYYDDDGGNGDDGNYNDDGQANAGDDNYNGDDDGNGDDGNNGDDYYNAGDDYYAADDDARRVLERKILSKTQCRHPARGIFKLRDYQEHVLDPLKSFVQDEWYRGQVSLEENGDQAGRMLDQGYDDDVYNNTDAANYYDDDGYKDPSQSKQRDVAANVRLTLVFAFLTVLGILGRRRRMRTRYYLVRARAQEDYLYYASSEVGGAKKVAFRDTREDQYEGACSHTLCGCYPVDPPVDPDEEDDEVEVMDYGITKRKKKRHHEDCVSRGFNCLLASCCGALCRCWFQCLSVCALAQEAREIRLLLPPRFQRVDYITHQPFHEYQKNVNDLRRGWLGKTRKKSGVMPHFNAISRLSRYILVVFSGTVGVILMTLLFNPRASFSWPDAIVLIATFIQSFLVLYVVHWIFHKSDLSLDAVIKFFAAGFAIATPSAILYEGILVNVILFCAWFCYTIAEWIGGDAFVDWVVAHYRFLWIIAELVNAYIVAAVTEELCKYYTFRAVEHPDLIFLTGLDRRNQDDSAVDGGLVKYPFGSFQISKLNKNNSFDSLSEYSHRSSASSQKRSVAEEYMLDPNKSEEDFFEEEQDVRTHRQKAAAVTTGMISIAVGLACAENFLYVFFLGGTSGGDDSSGAVLEEWIVLFFRSIFPVHALAAAMQSINMVRKFVECTEDNNHRIGVGRIVIPAVLLHGSFDAILMGINVYVESAWDRYREENDGEIPDGHPYNPVAVNMVAWVSIIFVMIVGILWYYRENRSQRLRLILLEEKEKATNGGGDLPYNNPSTGVTSPQAHSEVELV